VRSLSSFDSPEKGSTNSKNANTELLTEDSLRTRIAETVREVRDQTPLAGSITNTVTQNLVANAQLAFGGSAAMVYMPDEARGIVQAGRAFYINAGTILPIYEQSVVAGMDEAHSQHKPWVLDPVAVGLGELRSSLLRQAKQYPPTIIRCNASEAIALAGLWELNAGNAEGHARGVDSCDSVDSAYASAISLARCTGEVVAVSGEVDLVTDGKTVIYCTGGSPLMEKITGSGCALGGVTAVCAAVSDPLSAALTASLAFDVAGKNAAEKPEVHGPGSFQVAFLDELYTLSPEEISSADFRVEQVSE